MTDCRTDGIDATYTVVHINDGGYDPSHPHSEMNLNMQYTQAIAYPTPHIFYTIGGGLVWETDSKEPAEGDIYLELFNYMTNQPNVPQTIGISYSNLENEVPLEYATALCNKFAELGARGASVIFPSGNDGVGEGACVPNDSDASGSRSVQFIPEFPASCMCGVLSLF
jgi:tripeptidyl-peptidase-1